MDGILLKCRRDCLFHSRLVRRLMPCRVPRQAPMGWGPRWARREDHDAPAAYTPAEQSVCLQARLRWAGPHQGRSARLCHPLTHAGADQAPTQRPAFCWAGCQGQGSCCHRSPFPFPHWSGSSQVSKTDRVASRAQSGRQRPRHLRVGRPKATRHHTIAAMLVCAGTHALRQ
jgi:hypothetical protein